MSTSYVQARLKHIAEIPRILASVDPAESLLDRISLISDIEKTYWRGLITFRQLDMLIEWLDTGNIWNGYELAACLEAIASISLYTDDSLAQQCAGGEWTKEKILLELEYHSKNFTEILDYIATEENTLHV